MTNPPTLTAPEIDLIGQEGGIAVLHACNGFYGCQDAADGTWQGPLVGYAKRLKDEVTGREIQMVGRRYYNFARCESQPFVSAWFADKLAKRIAYHFSSPSVRPNLIVAAPMGGIILGALVANFLPRARYAFAEKEVLAIGNEGKREEARLVLARHELPRWSSTILIEDVCNNFSTTQVLVALLEERSCKVVGIACALNRSGQSDWMGIPVLSVINAPTEQWREDDPIIQEYLNSPRSTWCRLVRKPKREWAILASAMEEFGVAT